MKDKKKQAQENQPEEETVETEVAEEVCEDVEKEESIADEWHDRFVRLAADFDNFKKRSAAEKNAVYANATADAVAELLPIIDNLERAIAAAEDSPMKSGVEMVLTQALKAFENLNVFPVGNPGEAFDPQIHNAVMHVDDESLGENVIAEVFQKGYKLGDKVVRHALVKVAN
ncbi:MAG: nucleotide exchange factor GrpE [Clostridia bacterium]|nr:nucleotide exchange factor GrpE [Clostridia bacterium]